MSPAARMDYLLTNAFGTKTIHVNGQLFKVQHIIYLLSRITFIVQIFLFLILGRKLVLRYNSRVSNFYATLETKTIAWVNLLLYSFFVTSLMSIIFSLIGRSVFLESDILLLIPSAIFSVLLFSIGFLGYMQNYTVVDLVEDELESVEFSIKQYNHTQLKEKFLELFENQHIYKQRDLKITQISMILQTNRTYISNLINTEFNSTFSDFVNRYRVAEARKLLADSKQQNYSLNYVSEASGFGSVNSFIRIFRESEGITPGKFRDRIFLQAQEAVEVKI